MQRCAFDLWAAERRCLKIIWALRSFPIAAAGESDYLSLGFS